MSIPIKTLSRLETRHCPERLGQRLDALMYYGVGIGSGAGASVTFNPFSLSEGGISVGGTLRGGTGFIGAQGGVYYSEEGVSYSGGLGWGIGSGVAITGTHKILLFERRR